MTKPLPDLTRKPTAELILLMTIAAESRDYALATHVASEAKRRRLRCRQAVLEPLENADMAAIDWWDEAIAASRTVRITTRGGHHLYVVLLDGFLKGSRYGVYVGETQCKPENRFEQHLNGIHASGVVRRMGQCLLPELYEHLNPLSRKEAKALEPMLAEAFRQAGIRTEGGH